MEDDADSHAIFGKSKSTTKTAPEPAYGASPAKALSAKLAQAATSVGATTKTSSGLSVRVLSQPAGVAVVVAAAAALVVAGLKMGSRAYRRRQFLPLVDTAI